MTLALRIGEVARRSGLTIRTLRHYDDLGLLVPSAHTDGDQRLYSRATSPPSKRTSRRGGGRRDPWRRRLRRPANRGPGTAPHAGPEPASTRVKVATRLVRRSASNRKAWGSKVAHITAVGLAFNRGSNADNSP